MTARIDNYIPQIDRAVIETRYKQLCDIRDGINNDVAPLKKRLEEAANIAEEKRVASMVVAKELFDARGGKKWFQLKKEIGILAKTLSGILPPDPEDIKKAQEIFKAVK